MPKLILVYNSTANQEFARRVAQDNRGCEVRVEGNRVVIDCPGELRVTRDHALAAFRGTSADDDPDRFERLWKSLFLNRTGHIAKWTDSEVVLSDEPPPKPTERALNVIIRADLWERLDRAARALPKGTKREIVEAALDEYLRARNL